MVSPKVSICVPAYKAANTIRRTLQSLVIQTYKNIQIIVVDNNSNDGTVEIAKEFADKYNFVFVIEHDVTVPGHENFDRCIRYASGDFLCIFHSDDVYKNTIIEEEVNFLVEHPEVGAVFSYGYIIDENDNIITKYNTNRSFLNQQVYSFDELFPKVICYGNPFMTPTAMVRTEIYKMEIIRHSRYDNFYGTFDLDVWLRILKKHKIGFLFKRLIFYRMSKNSYTFRSLLNYKETILDGELNVIRRTIEENDYHDSICLKIYLRRRIDSELLNVFKAYVSGDYFEARELFKNIDLKGANLKQFWKYFIYSVVVKFRTPVKFRKMLISRQFKKELRGNLDCIEIK